MMFEGQFKYDVGLPGTLKLGGWKQLNHYAPEFLNPGILDTSSGIYAIVDQQIWKGSGDKAISAFARVSGSPDKQNLINNYFDTGVVFAGFVPGRDKDTFGAAFGYGNISNDLRQAQVADNDPVVSDLRVRSGNQLRSSDPPGLLGRAGLPVHLESQAVELAAMPTTPSRYPMPPSSAPGPISASDAVLHPPVHFNASWRGRRRCARRRFP